MALSLQKHGLKVYLRDPDSYTPHLETRKYLLLGSDDAEKKKQIAKFSVRDASVYPEYEAWLERIGKGLPMSASIVIVEYVVDKLFPI